jgi:hypothetical protein
MSSAPGIGAYPLKRAEAPRARHLQLHVAKLGRQMAVNRRIHPTGQDLLKRVARGPAIVRAPFDALCLHALHHPKRLG